MSTFLPNISLQPEIFTCQQLINNRVLGPIALVSKFVVSPSCLLYFDKRLANVSMNTLVLIETLKIVNKNAFWVLQDDASNKEYEKIAVLLCNPGKQEITSLAFNKYNPSCDVNIHTINYKNNIQEYITLYNLNDWCLNTIVPQIINPVDGMYFLIVMKNKKHFFPKAMSVQDFLQFNDDIKTKAQLYETRVNKVFNYLMSQQLTDQKQLFFLLLRVLRISNLKFVNDWILKYMKDSLHLIKN